MVRFPVMINCGYTDDQLGIAPVCKFIRVNRIFSGGGKIGAIRRCVRSGDCDRGSHGNPDSGERLRDSAKAAQRG